MAVTVSDMDRALLRLIADGEAVRSNPYCSVWPGHVEPELTVMTLSQVESYQKQRIKDGRKSSAVGKYQFIKSTLKECVGYLGCDPMRTVFSRDVQDALIIQRLIKFRKYDQWKAESIDTGKFMIFLAAEFASMPVPYDIPAGSIYKNSPRRNLKKGQSFYAGDGLNKANHDPDHLYQALEDIKAGGSGEVQEIDVTTTGSNRALPPTGVSEKAQVEKSSAGPGVGAYRGTRAGSQPQNSVSPQDYNPYIYGRIDPLDDRYDFRTGEKIKDIGIHGISSAAATPVQTETSGATNSPTNAGVAPVEAPSNPDAEDPRGQEQLPDLVPKPEEPAPPPTDKNPDEDPGAPGLPFGADEIIKAIEKKVEVIATKIDNLLPCVESVTDGYSLSDAISTATDDITGAVTDAVTGAVTDAKDDLISTSKSWLNSNKGPQ
jgi:muramidase (phage lysozyme)